MDTYVCSHCGRDAYFDGRCGDLPVLLCGCDKVGSPYYDGRCGDPAIILTKARPIKIPNRFPD